MFIFVIKGVYNIVINVDVFWVVWVFMRYEDIIWVYICMEKIVMENLCKKYFDIVFS